MKKNKVIFVKADDNLHSKLRLVAKAMDRPSSQIVREAINEKLDRIAEEKPEIKEALSNAA